MAKTADWLAATQAAKMADLPAERPEATTVDSPAAKMAGLWVAKTAERPEAKMADSPAAKMAGLWVAKTADCQGATQAAKTVATLAVTLQVVTLLVVKLQVVTLQAVRSEANWPAVKADLANRRMPTAFAPACLHRRDRRRIWRQRHLLPPGRCARLQRRQSSAPGSAGWHRQMPARRLVGSAATVPCPQRRQFRTRRGAASACDLLQSR